LNPVLPDSALWLKQWINVLHHLNLIAMNIFQSLARRLPVVLLPFLLGLIFYQCKPDIKPTGVLNIRTNVTPKTMDPIGSVSSATLNVAGRIFFSLLGPNTKTLEPEPILAKKVPVVRQVTEGPHKGESAFDFEILDEAVWDNGTPVTANDLLFTLKLVFHPGLPTKAWQGYFKYFDTIEIDPANPKKFTAYFKQYYILNLGSISEVPIYPAYNYDPNNRLEKFKLEDLRDEAKAAALKEDPDLKAFATEFTGPKFSSDKNGIVGCGPYRIELMNEQGVTMVKKDHWWGDELADRNPQLAAYPLRLVYKLINDDGVIENMLRTGDLDLAASITPSKFLEWKKDTALTNKYDFTTVQSDAYFFWQFNLQNPKLADKRVRQALAYCIDYDYLMKSVVFDMGKRTVGPVSPAKPYYAKDVPLYHFDIAKAKALLAEAGWTDSDGNGIVDKVIDGRMTEMSIDFLCTNATKVGEIIGNSLQQSALQAGVKVNIVPVDLSELTPRTQSGDFETAVYGGGFATGLTDLYQRYHSESLAPSGDNRSRFANARADSIIVAIRTTADEGRRNALYQEIQRILHEEVPEAYLYVPEQRIIVSKKFNYVLSYGRPGYFESMFRLK
jgi:peptide/nickel transport system substrate-binding protein